MKHVRIVVFASIVGLAAGAALAQPAGPGPGPQAGTPGAGTGPAGRGPGARWGEDFTPGWALMTAEERAEHQNRMRAMKTYEECNAYMLEHRKTMAARAAAQGKSMPPMNRDACAGLKP